MWATELSVAGGSISGAPSQSTNNQPGMRINASSGHESLREQTSAGFSGTLGARFCETSKSETEKMGGAPPRSAREAPWALLICSAGSARNDMETRNRKGKQRGLS